jgi:lipopolysaccharide exporter
MFNHLKVIVELSKTSFFKNLMVVMSGTVASQIIGLALTPIISRLFSPSDFGVYGSFNSLAGVFAAGATMQYTQAIILPKDNGDAVNIFCVSCLCTLTISFIILAGCIVAPSTINSVMGTDGIWALGLLTIATIVSGLNQTAQAWCVRIKAFKHTSVSQVVRSITSNGTQIGLGYINVGGLGLVSSNILGDIMASINLFRALLPDLLNLRGCIQLDRMQKAAKEYKDFPIYSATQNIINALSAGLPVLLLTNYFGIAVAGAYAFGYRILTLPMGFVLTALRQVLFQKAAETQHQGGSLSALYIKTSVGLFVMGVFPVLIFIIWTPQLFALFFGSQWVIAGEFARSLVVWIMFVFCNLPAVLFARLIRIQRTVFIYDLVLLTARSLVLVIGGLYYNAWQTIMAFSLVGALMNIFLIILVGHFVVKKEGGFSIKQLRTFLFGR